MQTYTHTTATHSLKGGGAATTPKIYTRSKITLSVIDFTNVKFSDGSSIEMTTTGFKLLWFVIKDIPESVGHSEIECLAATFGIVQDVQFRDKKQSGKSILRYRGHDQEA